MQGRGALRLGLAGVIAAAACGSSQDIKLCGQIPEGGCPIGRGGTCADELCAGLYDCVDGAWTLVTTCVPGGTGGAGGAPGPGAGGGGCEQVTIDHTGEATGCTPDLQEPDCPASAAETCTHTACLTGCLDFFLCTEEGWQEVAFCTEDGQIVLVP